MINCKEMNAGETACLTCMTSTPLTLYYKAENGDCVDLKGNEELRKHLENCSVITNEISKEHTCKTCKSGFGIYEM